MGKALESVDVSVDKTGPQSWESAAGFALVQAIYFPSRSPRLEINGGNI